MILAPGVHIIARGLPLKKRSRDVLPATVALVCRVSPGELVISLRIIGFGGGVKFARKSRHCEPANVARLATDREVATGRVIDPLPARSA